MIIVIIQLAPFHRVYKPDDDMLMLKYVAI